MALKLGGTDINGLYLGSTAINKAYLGATEVFSTGSPPAYDPDAQAYFDAMTVEPDATRKGLLNTIIVGLKSDGTWSVLDRLLIIAAHDEQAARVNAKDPTEIFSAINSPTFVTDRGFAGDGVSAYLSAVSPKTTFDFTGSNYTLNSASGGAWITAQTGTSAVFPFGTNGTATQNRTWISAANGVSNGSFRVNDATSDNLNHGGVGQLAHRTIVRESSSIKRGYVNGSLATDLTTASTTTTVGTVSVLRRATSYSDDRISLFYCGGSLSSSRVANIHTLFNTYLTTVGAI